MCNTLDGRNSPRRKRMSWPKGIIIVLTSILAAIGAFVFLHPRQLDVMFDATALTFQGIHGLQGDGNETLALSSNFLKGVNRIVLFKSNNAIPIWQRPDTMPAGSPVDAMHFKRGAQPSCDGIRLQPSGEKENSDGKVLSLFVESTTATCSIYMSWETGQIADLELPKDSRLDFQPLPLTEPPTSERPPPLVLMEYLAPARLLAQLHGEIAGVEAPFSCRRGHAFELSGFGLEIVSVGLAGSANDPVLTAWVRAPAVKTYTIDRSHCAFGLYMIGGPRMLLPWFFFFLVFGILWKTWGKE